MARSTAVKPKSDAYVGLLAIALVAMITSSVLMYFEYAQYPEQRPKISAAPPPRVPDTVPALGIPSTNVPPAAPTPPAGDAPPAGGNPPAGGTPPG